MCAGAFFIYTCLKTADPCWLAGAFVALRRIRHVVLYSGRLETMYE